MSAPEEVVDKTALPPPQTLGGVASAPAPQPKAQLRTRLLPHGKGIDIVLLTVVVIVRLAMSGDRDILALNQPYDDYWFVSAAHRWVWGGVYNQLAFAQLQLYAIWLKIMGLLGFPGRLAIDLFWIGGAAYLGFAVRRFCGRQWPAVVLFLYLIFHPYSLALFDRALSENLTACLCSIALAAFIDVWNYRSNGSAPSARKQMVSALVASIAFAAAYHSRKEGIVLVVPLALIALWSLVHRELWWSKKNRRLALGILIWPLIATVALGFALAGANALRWGVFARYELAAPGYVQAIQALNAIDPGGPTPRWVTVTAATRMKAYAVSPTFRELEGILEGPMVSQVVAQTELYSGVKGEIGNGWFYWTLRDAAAIAGWHRSARSAEAKYAAVASEINAAFSEGKLRRRTTLIPFVDPDWSKWLPVLPHAFLAEARQTIALSVFDLREPAEDANKAQRAVYVDSVGRRRAFERSSISGWLIAPPGSRIGLGPRESSDSSVLLQGTTRPDVPGAYPFRLTASTPPKNATVHIETPDGTRASIPLRTLQLGQVQRIAGLPNTAIGIDVISAPRTSPWANVLLAPLCSGWTVVGWIFSGFGLIAIFLFGRDEDGPELAARLALIALLSGIAARALLLAVLDSSSWSGTQARYSLPSIPLFATFGAVALWKIAERVRRMQIFARSMERIV